MELNNFELTEGTLNQVYNKIKNCKVTKPPYETQGYYSKEFFLDKKDGIEVEHTIAGMRITDEVTINGIRYYYYQDLVNNKSYIGTFDGATFINVVPSGFDIDGDSPIRLSLGRGVVGPKSSSAREIESPEEGSSTGSDIEWELIPSYAGGYVKFKYTGVQDVETGDYIAYKDGALNGGINRVEYVDEFDYIYVIGTNSRGTIPLAGSTFDVYKVDDGVIPGNTILVGGSTGVSLVIVDGYNQVLSHEIVTTNDPIIDLVNFDGNLFALTTNYIYFSRTTYDDNTQFYPLDRFQIVGGERLFPMGKALLLFATANKLYSPTEDQTGNRSYVGYDVNYNGDLYSKYSCIFTDQTIYLLQSNKELKQINIVSYDSSAYDIAVQDVLTSNKGLFKGLADDGEMYISANQDYINFLYNYEGTTVNYEFDKSYQHFIENEYPVNIYKFTDKILSNDNIYIEGGYTHDGVEYEQDINFMINTGKYLIKPYTVTTMFGLIDTKLSVRLSTNYEIGGQLIEAYKDLSNFDVDNRLNDGLTGDELIGSDTEPAEKSKYNGTFVSIQSNHMRVGRMIKFKYSSFDRFQIGNTYVLAEKSKLFINEPLLTN